MSILEKLKAKQAADEQAALLAAMPTEVHEIASVDLDDGTTDHISQIAKSTFVIENKFETKIPHLIGKVPACDTAEELALAELQVSRELVEAAHLKKNTQPAAQISGIIPVVDAPKSNGEEVALAKEMYEPAIEEIKIQTPRNNQLVHDFSKLKKADMVKIYGDLISRAGGHADSLSQDIVALEAMREQVASAELRVEAIVEQHKAELQLVVDHANDQITKARAIGGGENGMTTYINCTTSERGMIDIDLLNSLKEISKRVCETYAAENSCPIPWTITEIPFGKGKALFNEAVAADLKAHPLTQAYLDTTIDLMDWCQQAFILNSAFVVKGRG